MRHHAAGLAAPLLALLLLAGPVPAAPPSGGSISIEPATGAGDGRTRATPPFDAAAADALAAHGFTILEDPGHSAYVAVLAIRQTPVGTGEARIPAGRGAIAPGGAYGGVGGGVTIPLGSGKAVVPLLRTELDLRILKRGDPAAVWHGSAVTVRAEGTRAGTDEAVAADLSTALLRSYPTEPQGIVGVP